MSFRGRLSGQNDVTWGQASIGVPHDQKVNKAEEITYISTDIDKGLNYGIKHTDTQHNDTRPRANQYNDTRHNVKLSIAFLLLLVKPACSALV
jgi:hypothetical protein